LLEVTGLSCHYGPIQALWDITLSVDEGELVALVGANGAGKTTLLRAISGIQPASAGKIRFDGADKRVRLGIVQVPEGRQVLGPMSVENNLILGGYTRNRQESAETLAQVYEMFPVLRERSGQPAGLLSGGQQQMLAIARALMARPRILFLDEPSMGLSPILVDEVFEHVRALQAAGTTIFLVEQNAYRALSIADRAYVFEAGRLILADTGEALMANERIKAAYLGL